MKPLTKYLAAFLMMAFLATNSFAGNEMFGTVYTFTKGDVTIHSYVAPDNAFYDNTQIIETNDKLIVVDAQMVLPVAHEVRGYIDSLKKPIERVIISHGHPDHWLGLEAFKGEDIYALAEVKGFLDKAGESILQARRESMGDLLPKHATLPNKELKTGSMVIDGVRIDIEKRLDGEADITAVIKLPDHGIVIAQDLIFNGVHAFYGQNTLGHWIETLDEFLAMDGYSYFPAGHGVPASKNDIRAYKAYLKDMKVIVAKAKDGAEVKTAATKAFPGFTGASLLDISAFYAFKK